MTRAIERLSPLKVGKVKPKNRKASTMLCDGGGLYLQVSYGKDDNIRRSWIFRYQRPGLPVRDMGLGSLNDISLRDARQQATSNRRLLKDGLDPIVERNARIARNLASTAGVITFKQAAETYIQQHRASWKSVNHARQWPQSLEDYAYPTLARMSVADIETEHVVEVLRPIWNDKVETANRVRNRIELILAGQIRLSQGSERPRAGRTLPDGEGISTSCWPSRARSERQNTNRLCPTIKLRISWSSCGTAKAQLRWRWSSLP